MPKPKSKSGYKTKRKYGCPYCDVKLPRSELVAHVQEEHEMMIPQAYTAARAVYDHINGKNYGTCMICGARVYEWDDRIWRYKNLCDNPKCREALTTKAKNNHLDDPEKQKIMLQGRKISGEYKFRDGSKKSYVGSYEKKTLEFMDRVMNIPSKDIETPGPTFSYEYDGETHTWITDIFYIPAMLVIDVKDGGSNPNTRPMESYREKQVEKEKAIIKDGKYNYLRLTDNDFGQLMSAIADIRYGDTVNDPQKGIYINEGSSPAGNVMIGSVKPGCRDYIIPRTIRNTFTEDDPDTFIFGNTWLDKGFMFDENGEVIVDTIENLLENTKTKAGDQCYRKIYFNPDKSNMGKLAKKLREERAKKKVKEKNKAMRQLEAANILYGRNVFMTPSTVYHLEDTEIVRGYQNPIETDAFYEHYFEDEYMKRVVLEQASDSITMNTKFVGKHLQLIRGSEGCYITCIDPSYKIASPYYENEEDIPPEVIELMDDLYEAYKNRKDGEKHG